jgi:large subunit ribosomal protein L17
MRHRIAGRILGRDAGHRKALFRNLVRELYLHERITTTEAKARAIRADAEKLISKAKRGLAEGGNRVHAQRLVNAYLNDKAVSHKLFAEIAPRYTNRPGGYTRMVKIGKRLGDAADMAVLELVEGEAAAE